MTTIRQLGYLEFEVSGLAAWETFATNVLGLGVSRRDADGEGFALCMDDHAHRFFVRQGPADDLAAIGWEVADGDALGALVDRLRKGGVEVTPASDAELRARDVAAMVKLRDPAGISLEIFHGPKMATTPFESKLVATKFVADELGLGHLVITTRDRDESLAFYREKLGFILSDYIVCDIGGYHVDIAFMHTNPRHHSLALGSRMPKRIHHFLLQVGSMDDVGMAYDRAQDAGVQIEQSLGRHPNDRMFSFYAQTPSGFQFEYGWGGREVDDAAWTTTTYDRISEWGHRRMPRNKPRPAAQ